MSSEQPKHVVQFVRFCRFGDKWCAFLSDKPQAGPLRAAAGLQFRVLIPIPQVCLDNPEPPSTEEQFEEIRAQIAAGVQVEVTEIPHREVRP